MYRSTTGVASLLLGISLGASALAAGGTKHHSELLAPFGLDATDPGFWSIGLGMIEGMIDELEALG